jgi:hypothetical protein
MTMRSTTVAVHWPEERMVVQWPMPTSDGVTLVWPVQ